MSITQATALIASHFAAGLIDQATAIRAQIAIRGAHYGNRMTSAERESMLANRFGIAVREG
jgi:hypothetical protein